MNSTSFSSCKLIPYTLCLYNYSFSKCCQFVHKLPLRSTSHTLYLYCLFSLLSLCAAWRICPPDCCLWRAPRRDLDPRSSVPRLSHGEWNRPVLHGPRLWLWSQARGGVPLQWIPFSEAKGEPPLTALTYSYLGIWAHHPLLSHSLVTVVCVPPCLQVPEPRSLSPLCIPMCGPYLDLLIQTTSTSNTACCSMGKTDQSACVFIKTQCCAYSYMHGMHILYVHVAFSCLGLVYVCTSKWHTV